ncbi:MAG: hypothetical protein ACU0BN_04685 [Sulfitobacter sp.]
MWGWFRRRSLFFQMLLVVPIACAVAVTVFVGNMGLALMGTAVALYAPVVGWLLGVFGVVFTKAAKIVARDRKQKL